MDDPSTSTIGETCTAPEDALAALSVVFSSLGRVLLCLDRDHTVVHASRSLDRLLGPGAASRLVGREISEILGDELFGRSGALAGALRRGERREGWRGHLRSGDSHHVVAISVAPIQHQPGDPCDPRVHSFVVLRPEAEEDPGDGRGPTVVSGMIARSPAMLRIFALVESLRHSEATVLLTGESGTGKEVLARALHEHSPRARGPFVPVNCAALPSELLESELFGHVRGAFTGAIRDRDGRFAMAEGGTLFLDEIGDMPLPLQVRLLRVLQERTYERVGDSHTRRTDARIIAATNADLRAGLVHGTFREDLYYRLRVVPIELPPLRARREDIEPLALRLLTRISERRGRSLRLSPAALQLILGYGFPGNVRELENALEYAVAVCPGQTVLPEHLPAELASTRPAPLIPQPPAASTTIPPTPDRSGETQTLRELLDRHQWRRDEVARVLGISRTTLWRRMRELGLMSPGRLALGA